MRAGTSSSLASGGDGVARALRVLIVIESVSYMCNTRVQKIARTLERPGGHGHVSAVSGRSPQVFHGG